MPKVSVQPARQRELSVTNHFHRMNLQQCVQYTLRLLVADAEDSRDVARREPGAWQSPEPAQIPPVLRR